jgi:hypothetical protein
MDYPRFERIEGPQDRRHLAYHGGRLVELVLRTADLVGAAWSRRTPRSSVPNCLMEALVASTPPRQPSKS